MERLTSMQHFTFVPKTLVSCGLGTVLIINGLLLTSGCALTKPRPKHDPFSEFSCGEKCPCGSHSKIPPSEPLH